MIKTYLKIALLISLCISCKSSQNYVSNEPYNQEDNLEDIPAIVHTNDSIVKFDELQSLIISKAENLTSKTNFVTEHFQANLNHKDFQDIAFNETKNNIYVEFTLTRDKKPQNIFTNVSDDQSLDKKLKKVFDKLDFSKVKLVDVEPLNKYTIIVIQQDTVGNTIKCNSTAIGYSPPIYNKCKEEYNYHNLNACNYLYISEYINNNIDLSLVREEDIDNFYRVYPKFIIDKKGKVVAAKISSENKEITESYYKAIKKLPTATTPAKFNGKNFYYGYNFPTSIVRLIRNNNDFNEYYRYKKSSGKPIKEIMKDYINLLQRKKRRKAIEKVGF